MGALLRRANTLEIMSDTTYNQAMRTMSARGWRIEEPGDLGAPEMPAVLTHAARLAGTTSESLARDTGWPKSCIDEVLAASTEARPEIHL